MALSAARARAQPMHVSGCSFVKVARVIGAAASAAVLSVVSGAVTEHYWKASVVDCAEMGLMLCLALSLMLESHYMNPT